MGADTDSTSQIFLIRSVSLPSDSVCLFLFYLFIFNHFLSNSNEPLLASGSVSSRKVLEGLQIHFSSQWILSGLLSKLRSGEEAQRRSQAVTSDLVPQIQRPLLEVGVAR